MGVKPQVMRDSEQVVPQSHPHEDHDGDREDQPERALGELVNDNQENTALASHGADCRLATVPPHRGANIGADLALTRTPSRATT